MMTGIVLWGAEIKNRSTAINPDQLQKLSLNWRADYERFAPWDEVSGLTDTVENRCWVSAKKDSRSTIIVGHCSSGMDLAWYFLQKKLVNEWDSTLASSQWTGRGQLGRTWHSPAGNLYGTLCLPESARQMTAYLPLLIGYALIKGLSHSGVEVRLKWPNDLVINNKKVGGVLIEERAGVVMAGIGINLISSPPDESLRSGHAIPSACLQDFGYALKPLSLWQHLVKTVHYHFNTIVATDLSDFMSTVNSHLAFVGGTVLVNDYVNEPYHAKLIGLSSNGGLKLLINNEIKVVRSASIYPLNGCKSQGVL